MIEGTKVTLDGTKTRTGEDSGLRYSWEQVSGPKVKIADENMAIASFEAPKVSSDRDKLTLKFVLLITSDSGNDGRNSINNNDNKNSVIVIVKQDRSAMWDYRLQWMIKIRFILAMPKTLKTAMVAKIMTTENQKRQRTLSLSHRHISRHPSKAPK